ncbi:MAG: hypothetical protein WC554_02045 [Clostridia bacterium]
MIRAIKEDRLAGIKVKDICKKYELTYGIYYYLIKSSEDFPKNTDIKKKYYDDIKNKILIDRCENNMNISDIAKKYKIHINTYYKLCGNIKKQGFNK